MALAGARGASRSGSTSVTTMHALFRRKVECKMAAAEILAEAANPYRAAHTRRVSATRLAPTSGQVVTQSQSGSPRPDSPVRILYAQPRIQVSVGLHRPDPVLCIGIQVRRCAQAAPAVRRAA
jgi:hypothetical protein